MNLHFLLEHQKILKNLHGTVVQFFYFVLIFGVTEVWSMFRLLQTVLFLTNSVFDALFACFDESMDCISDIRHGEVRVQ